MEENATVSLTNVAVFIDYENVYRSLLGLRTNILRMGFFEKLREWCRQHSKRIVRMVVYCNFDNFDLHESYHQSILQNYGVETVHTSNQGKNYADLKITIDVLTSIYSNNNIDEFFIMSNDKDMTPLLNAIRENKRSVSIITTGNNYNPSIVEFADEHIKMEDVCKTDVPKLIIDDIAQAYWAKVQSYLQRQLDEYPVNKKYYHYDLDYTLANEVRYSKIMGYELATIIKSFYSDCKIFFYKYEHKKQSKTAFAPTNMKDRLFQYNLCKESDIIESFDIDYVIESTYQQWLNKS